MTSIAIYHQLMVRLLLYSVWKNVYHQKGEFIALTDIKVRTAKPTDKVYKLTDGDGMVFVGISNGSKYWRMQYRFAGKEKNVSARCLSGNIFS